MKKYVFLPVLALFYNGAAVAGDRTATLTFAESSPSILNLRLESQNIELKTRSLHDGSSRTVAHIQGTFDEDESHIVVNDRIVAVREDGKFSVDIPIERSQEEVVIRAVDFAGNIQTEKGWITSAEPKLANESIEAPHIAVKTPVAPVAKTPMVASAAKKKSIEISPKPKRTPAAMKIYRRPRRRSAVLVFLHLPLVGLLSPIAKSVASIFPKMRFVSESLMNARSFQS